MDILDNTQKMDVINIKYSFIRNLCLSYVLIFITKLYGLVFFLSIILAWVIFFKLKLYESKYFNQQYEIYERENNEIGVVFIQIFITHIGFQRSFDQKLNQTQNIRENEVNNLYYFLQNSFIILAMLFDLLFINQGNFDNLRNAFYLQILFLLNSYFQSIIWVTKYFKYGPQSRQIAIDEFNFDGLECKKIIEEQLKILPNEQFIYFQIQNKSYSFYKEMLILLLQKNKKIINIIYKANIRKNIFIKDSNKKKIEIKVFDIPFGVVSLIALKKNLYCLYNHKLSIFCNEDTSNSKLIFQNLAEEYKIIAHLQWDQWLYRSNLNQFRQQLLLIHAFNKFIHPDMMLSSQQILYDLFDQ
ncbi:hypothetical protein ABPG74_022902 [Tetrahymena malaccensis]